MPGDMYIERRERHPPEGDRPLRPGPLPGLLLGAALGVTVFLLAGLVHERFESGKKVPAAPPRGFAFGGDARAPVRVLATLGGDGVQAALLPLREDGASTGSEGRILDSALFPAGPARTWARLVVANPPTGKTVTLDLGHGGVVLDTPAGPAPCEDLSAVVAARLPELSPHRLLDLRVSHAADATVEVPPGGFVRILVAFPPETGIPAAAGAVINGGPRLVPREVPVERIRDVLLDGRVDALVDAGRAQAKARGGPGAER
jgi:hypothetical protein